MARSKRTSYSVRADILQSLRWSTMANHLGFRSVAAWLTLLAENGVHDFDEAIYTMSRRGKELYAISKEEESEKPLKVNVRRAYRVELDRLFQLALSVPELQASNQRVFMGQGGVQPLALRGRGHRYPSRRATGPRLGLPLRDAGGDFGADRIPRRPSGVPTAGNRYGLTPRVEGPHSA